MSESLPTRARALADELDPTEDELSLTVVGTNLLRALADENEILRVRVHNLEMIDAFVDACSPPPGLDADGDRLWNLVVQLGEALEETWRVNSWTTKAAAAQAAFREALEAHHV